MTDANDSFLPDEYEVPKGDSNYMSLEDGENRFRILSKPLLGWEDWKDAKPIRFPMDQKPDKPINPQQEIKHFWAFVAWDYSDSKIKVLSITQKGIQKKISSLSKDKDWGLPFKFDIKITKSGSGLETKYELFPVPPAPISEEIRAAFAAKPCDLDKLYKGEDPFKDVKGSTEPLPF